MGPRTDSRSLEAPAAELIGCVRRLHGRGWCDGTGGNFSVTVGRDPLRLLITATGVDKGRIDATRLLTVGPEGRPVGTGPLNPSAETLLHVTLVRQTGAGAVLHTHSIWNTLVGQHFEGAGTLRLTGYEMLKGIDGVQRHDEAVSVPVLSNSQDIPALAARVTDRIRSAPEARGLLIAGHGLYAWGRDVDEAERHVEIFEFLFQLVGRRVRLAPYPQ